MKFLFVCSANRLRSPTAEAAFSNIQGVQALSAGTNPDAETPVSADLIEWRHHFRNGEDASRKATGEIRASASRKENRCPWHPRRIQLHGPESPPSSEKEDAPVSVWNRG